MAELVSSDPVEIISLIILVSLAIGLTVAGLLYFSSDKYKRKVAAEDERLAALRRQQAATPPEPQPMQPDPKSVAGILPLLNLKKNYTHGYMTAFNLGLRRDRAQAFVAEMEQLIDGIGTSDKTSSEVREEVARAFHSRFLGPIWPGELTDESQHVKDYFNLLIAYRDAWFLENMPPEPERKVVAFNLVPPGKPGTHVEIHFSGADEDTGKATIRAFIERHKDELKRYQGTGALHLVSKETKLRIHNVSLRELAPEPPPPPKGVVVAPGIAIEDQFREQHVYILGLPRSGKSTLMRTMMLQDIEAGNGACVVDPHGELIDDILPRIPKHREQDVILFSIDTLIPFNIFRATTEPEKAQLVGDIITLFERLKGVPGQRMDAILRYAVRTLVEVPGATFLDIHRMLTDDTYLQWAVSTANIPALTLYWNKTYREYPGKDAAHPILSRMSQFVLSSDIEKVLGRPSTLDFYDVIQSGKVLLADLSKGKFGEETTTLLGALLVSQLQLAGMRRAKIPKPQRTPYYMYVDEFHNFKTSAFATILSEMPKYGLFLTMAHQYNYQLDEDTRRAVLGTVGNQIFFKLGPEDVRYVLPYIGDVDPKTLLKFPKGRAVYNSPNLAPREMTTSIYEPPGEVASPEAILAKTLKTYCAAPTAHIRPIPPTVPDEEPGPSSPPPV